MIIADHRPVFIYLNKHGCKAYVKALIEQYIGLDPLLIISAYNHREFQSRFPNLEVKILATYENRWRLLIGIQNCVRTVREMLSDIMRPQLILPSFHPWNNVIISFSQRKKIRTTLVVHDFVTHIGERSRLVEWLQQRAMLRADAVVFLTEYVKKQAEKKTGKSEQYSIHSHPILPSYTTNNLPYNPQPSILCLGRIVAYKGIHVLLEAAQDLDIKQLTIAGVNSDLDIEPNHKLNLINEQLTDDQISKLLETHEILALPYLDTSQSGVLTLGVDAGMVMLVTQVGGLIEQVPSEAALWVDPTVDSVRQGLQRLITEPILYAQIKAKIIAYRATLKEESG